MQDVITIRSTYILTVTFSNKNFLTQDVDHMIVAYDRVEYGMPVTGLCSTNCQPVCYFLFS